MKDKQVATMTLSTPREVIETERARLIQSSIDSKDWWNTPNRSDWARIRFGKDLKKPAEEIYKEMDGDVSYVYGSSKGYCQICGENFKLDEKFRVLTFSFCDEYDCGMSIHKKCKEMK